MSRASRIVAVLSGALLLACAGIVPATAAEPEGAESGQGPPQEAIAVPYLGEARLSPAAPWSVASCSDAPPGLVVECAPDRVTLTAEGYDPEWGEHVLVVGLVGPVGPLEVRHRVVLAPPEAPAAEPLVWGVPVASGATVLIPVAALDVTCTRCTPGVARLEVGAVDPAAAGSALATGSHVVVRTTPGFVGEAVVPVRVLDDAGQPAEFAIAVRVGQAPEAPFGGLHVLAAVGADGSAAIDLAVLTWPAPATDAAFRCSTALAGVVSCADGVATYTVPIADPDAEPTPFLDQFAVRVVRGDGRLTTASVTLVPAAAEAHDGLTELRLVAVEGGADAALLVGLRPPPDDADAPVESLFAEIAGPLSRHGLAG